ncbi:RDD family protein [Ferrimonas gelatinilytica]|uniref:RDD family protein n=1 Tax=Ferrimonas gelatinilytica TaxID=1255257 RepID=A0ABP9SH25_9GAMM
MQYGGFWLRLLAGVIDTLLLMAVLTPGITLVFGQSLAQSSLLAKAVSYLLPAIAVIIFWVQRSATPGKSLLRLRIVNADGGGTPTKRQLVVRYLGYYIATLPLFLGLFWIAWDPRKQGWHDKLSQTLVVRDPPNRRT